MKIYLKYLFFITLVLFLNFEALAQDTKVVSNPSKIFESGNNFYKNKDYKKALENYKKIEGLNNGYIYYNLGNTYLKLGENANALSSYIKAQELLPRDNKVNKNLNYTYERMNIERTDFDYILNFFKLLNVKESIIVFIIVWSLIFLYFFFKRSNKIHPYLTGVVNIILIPIFIYLLISFTIRITDQNNAIIITKESEVKISNNEQDITLYKLKEGDRVNINGEIKDWYKISSRQGRGWINKSSIAKLSIF